LKEDIAKCILELQQIHECVAQILIMTAEMQTVRQRGRETDRRTDRETREKAQTASTDRKRGSTRTSCAQRGESLSRATSDKPRASESKNTFGDGKPRRDSGDGSAHSHASTKQSARRRDDWVRVGSKVEIRQPHRNFSLNGLLCQNYHISIKQSVLCWSPLSLSELTTVEKTCLSESYA
jgi:hypothetical protein